MRDSRSPEGSTISPVKAAASSRSHPAPSGLRWQRLDALRGAAIVWMVAFHFAFDLNHMGWIRPAYHFTSDALWTTQRTCIVTLFLLCAGLGQAAALQAGQGWPRFWRRWAQVAACAALVSAGSALMFPQSWISFGVLHGVALMLIIVRCLPVGGAALWVLGAVALALPHGVQSPWFDHRWSNWVGLVTHKPFTEDYVPVLPWLGVMLWGLAAGQWLMARRPAWLAGSLPPGTQVLAWLGQRPLTIYMVHQPLLIGLLTALQGWRPGA